MAAKRETARREAPFFSIVMPVYGVEPYIASAVGDILNQSFEDWELILVDDCTKDASTQIAETVIDGDPRVKIVRHDKNQGLSAARNTGMAHSSGDYLWIPDPDDRYDHELLALVFESLNSHAVDLLIFGHTYDYYDERETFLYQDILALDPAFYPQQNELRTRVLALEQKTHLGYVWNKLYRLDRIVTQKLLFKDEAPLIEDILFNLEYLENISTMTICAATPYHYAKRMKANLTNAFVANYFELHRARIDSLKKLLERWGLFDSQARSVLGSLFGRYILSALERNCDIRKNMSHRDRISWCKTLFDDPLFDELIPCARAAASRSLSLCLFALRRKSALLCTAIGRGIHIVQSGALPVFTKIKSGR
jgi:glycosyltransferase involved in cell wall biosynthesis